MYIYVNNYAGKTNSFFNRLGFFGISVPEKPTPAPSAVPTEQPKVDPTAKYATFLQGPKSYSKKLDWSGKWSKTYYDGGSFGAFGCGLCCLANIYCSYTPYKCSPVDAYKFAKKETGYGGGGAIDWPYLKKALEQMGFGCEISRKPKKYSKFQERVKNAKGLIVVVSSNYSTCYWRDTPGHYVTILEYDEKSDKVFLGDSGNPNHNRHWVELEKIYKSIKMSSSWHILGVTYYNEAQDKWKNKTISGKCYLPDEWYK